MFLTDQPVQRPERVSLQGEIGRMLVRAGSLISGLSEKVQMTITVAETSRICGGLGTQGTHIEPTGLPASRALIKPER